MEPITRSPDLERLFNEGYEVQVLSGHLLLHSVPYLTVGKEVAYGILVSTLDQSGDVTAYSPASDHTVSFAGSHPCGTDGAELLSIKNGTERREILPGLWVDHRFSARPQDNYRDYYHKMTAYVKLLRAPLVELGIEADARTFRGNPESIDESPFNFSDTNSARAGMSAINNRVADQKIAILGIGGTGSYVLDFVAKMPVTQIHLFDGDVLLSHNAFRAPGSPTIEELRAIPNKAEYHSWTYKRMHRHIHPHAYNIDSTKLQELDAFDFVFLCMDGGADKQAIVQYLKDHGKSFVDAGLSMRINDTALRGQVRTTLVTPESMDLVTPYVPAPSNDPQAEIYESNAQIAELNALNACLAVMAWKRHNGIYDPLSHPDHTVFNVRKGSLVAYNENQS